MARDRGKDPSHVETGSEKFQKPNPSHPQFKHPHGPT